MIDSLRSANASFSNHGTQGLATANAHSSAGDDSNMIPLINIVFLMLIFFMVAGKIAARDAASFQPPETTIATKAPNNTISVTIADDGVVWLDNQPQLHIDAMTSQHWQDLSDQLAKSSQVLINADANLPARQLDPLLNALRASGIEQIQLAVQALP